MNCKLTVKVCGITREKDARTALALGVDYIGLNVWAHTPRCVSLEVVNTLLPVIPRGKRVLVDVSPSVDSLARFAGDFDFFQIHFSHDTPVEVVTSWQTTVGRERLWLAPKCPPEIEIPSWLLDCADTFLVDGFKKDAFGGTGQTADWERFSQLKESHPNKQWILAGGLSPDNILSALFASKTNFVDLNSGVESAPGIKCAEKLQRLFDTIKSAS